MNISGVHCLVCVNFFLLIFVKWLKGTSPLLWPLQCAIQWAWAGESPILSTRCLPYIFGGLFESLFLHMYPSLTSLRESFQLPLAIFSTCLPEFHMEQNLLNHEHDSIKWPEKCNKPYPINVHENCPHWNE